MFEKVVVRRSSLHENILDPGILAEALLFYQKVHVVFDSSSLCSLLSSIGPDTLAEIMERGYLTGTFVRDLLGTHTNTKSGIQTHNFVAVEVRGNKEGKFRSKEDYLTILYERTLGKSHAAKKAARKFGSLVSYKRLGTKDFGPDLITAAARADIASDQFTTMAVRAALTKLVPGLAVEPGWYFRIVDVSDGFLVDTNFDFKSINKYYRKEHSDTEITPALLLSTLLDSRADIAISAHYLSDIITPEAYSEVMKIKFSNILDSRTRNEDGIERFQESTLNDARAIRQAINSGERSFSDFVKLLPKAEKFKNWIANAHPDAKLLDEYYKTITADSWFQKLPGKTYRFIFFTAAGALTEVVFPTGVGTTAGVALGAVDSFVLDKILRGWRPNQFIEDHLKKFVGS